MKKELCQDSTRLSINTVTERCMSNASQINEVSMLKLLKITRKKMFVLGWGLCLILSMGLSFSLNAGDCISGNCVNGQGIMTFANGDKYIGEFKTERKSGYGVYHFVNGDRYEGDFKDDYPDGHGKAYLANGNIYEGEFKNNFPNGKGTMRYHNGNVYVGEWKQGLKDGFGSMNYENGSKYVGEWRNGKKHGQGNYVQSTANPNIEIKKPQKSSETKMTGEKKSTPFWSGTKS